MIYAYPLTLQELVELVRYDEDRRTFSGLFRTTLDNSDYVREMKKKLDSYQNFDQYLVDALRTR